MFTGKEILIAVVSTVITIVSMLAIIKWLSNTLLNYLRETLLELKQNDVEAFKRLSDVEKCIPAIKGNISRNEKDIEKIRNDLTKCQEKHLI